MIIKLFPCGFCQGYEVSLGYLAFCCYQNLFLFFFAGHGNHKENSPFLNSAEAGKGGDYYDRNLALFEVISNCFSYS